MKRKVIQLCTSIAMAADCGVSDGDERILALCDDGTMWELTRYHDKEKGFQVKWDLLAPIPDSEPHKEARDGD